MGGGSVLEHYGTAIAALYDKLWGAIMGMESAHMGRILSEALAENHAWTSAMAVCKKMITDEMCAVAWMPIQFSACW